MPEKTPGQTAYEGAWRVHQELYPKAHRVPWRELHASHKRTWEAAAQAVLDLRDFPPLALTPSAEEDDDDA